MKLWQKEIVFDAQTEAFTVGNDFVYDQKLVYFDCIASIGHAKMLLKQALISEKEFSELKTELEKIIELNKSGKFIIAQSDEDSHTKIENHLANALGGTGKKIHLLRSRNDQVVASVALYSKHELKEIISLVEALALGFEKLGSVNTQMPGYTHMQKAMPSSVSLWAGAFKESLKLDLKSLNLALVAVDESPLGSAAGYGLPVEHDSKFVAESLGFSKVYSNPLYVQNSRLKKDLVVVGALLQVMCTLNKLAADLMLFTMGEFAFFSLPEKFLSGSSIMPQKKNYDLLEILRANSSEVYCSFAKIFSLSNNLVSGYNRDFQLSKHALIDAFEITEKSVKMGIIITENLQVNKESIEKACTKELFAAEKATKLALKGIPFRDAYKKVSDEL